MRGVKEFTRSGSLSLDGFLGSSADWLDRYKPFIEDGKTIVVSPHKVEAHLRALIKQAFES